MYGSVIRHPNFFHDILKFLRKTGLVGEKLYQFVVNQMNTDHKRKLVLKTWVTFREINPDLKNVQRIINAGKVDFHLLIGKRDRVIPIRFTKKLMRGVKNKNALHLVDTGHTMMSHKIGKYLSELIQDNKKGAT